MYPLILAVKVCIPSVLPTNRISAYLTTKHCFAFLTFVYLRMYSLFLAVASWLLCKEHETVSCNKWLPTNNPTLQITHCSSFPIEHFHSWWNLQFNIFFCTYIYMYLGILLGSGLYPPRKKQTPKQFAIRKKWKDYQGKISAYDIALRIVFVILSWSVMIKQNMSGNSCHHCHNLLSTEPVFRRACCEGCFHQWYIQSRDLICCPRCRLDSLQHFSRILLWISMVFLLLEDTTDQPPAKTRRVEDRENWVICLEELTEIAKVMTTKSCCKQTALIDCLLGGCNLRLWEKYFILLSVSPKCQHWTTEANWYLIVDILRNSS